jgi:hypothetical protein
MKDLQSQVRSVLGGDWDSSHSPWEGLMRLYETDREVFYLLACGGLGDGVDEVTRPLADLARQVRTAVRGTYRIDQASGNSEAVITPRSGATIAVPGHLVAKVKRFLLEIDGKGSSDKPGTDYEGRPVSEAEVRFKLGESSEWERDQARIQARCEATPAVFTVREQDLRSLQTLPPYVTYGLIKCAKQTLLAPTRVYRGLNRGSEAPQTLRQGWAVCGKPSRAYDNDGGAVPAQSGMLYMVFADSDGYVFDWDWVQEDPERPGDPLNPELRFGNPVPESRELVLDVPDHLHPGKFDATRPTPSVSGDCVFCYMKDDPSFGERINEDLTVFYALSDRETITGFKIKNVQRILTEEQMLSLTDAPGLKVLILPVLRKTLQEHQEMTIKLYEIIIEAWVNVTFTLPALASDDSDLAIATGVAHK